MNTRRRTPTMAGLALLLAALALAGCAGLRLPAIDPSGRRIFSPAPASTTLAGPSPVARGFGFLQPAYTRPPIPPPCEDAGVPFAAAPAPVLLGPPEACPPAVATCDPLILAPTALAAPAREKVTLTPRRLIAPVGGEVVLVAGLCGADGYYVKGQPLEWFLEEESVGHFVEVGGEHEARARPAFARDPGKRGPDFAIGHSLWRPHVITRGNADPLDDVTVAKGQGWISLASGGEGTSRVSVVAPGSESWETRRQTAVIHWIDGQWQFPCASTAPAGGSKTLATVVTRRTSGEPAAGWLVRYEVVDGVPAAFAPSGASAVDVITDECGRAAVELVAAGNQGGTTPIKLQVIRPGGCAGDPPRLVVGQGWTSVNWSAPGLSLSISGPSTAALDTTVSYRIVVTGSGGLPASGVTVTDVLPRELTFQSSNPPAELFGDRLQWRLGDVSGGQSRVIEIHCNATTRGTARHCATARSDGGLTAEDCTDTAIFAPSLAVNMTGPETAEVGQQAQYRIEITNTGDAALSDVLLRDAFDPGLVHADGGESPIERSLGGLAAGETRRLAVTFNVVSEGTHCHTLEVSAAGAQTAVVRRCLTATRKTIPPRPEVELSLRGPSERTAGEFARYDVQITNSGNVPLTGVRLIFEYPASMSPAEASAGYGQGARSLIWSIDRLDVNATASRVAVMRTLRADAAAMVRADVTSGEQASDRGELATRIVAAPAPPSLPPAEGPGLPGGPPPSGELQLSINALGNPVKLGETTQYVIVVKNDRVVSDRDVTLTVTLPEGLQFDGLTGPVAAPGASAQRVPFNTIRELRAGEQLAPIYVRVKALRAGEYTVRAVVRSARSPDGLVDTAETTVSE